MKKVQPGSGRVLKSTPHHVTKKQRQSGAKTPGTHATGARGPSTVNLSDWRAFDLYLPLDRRIGVTIALKPEILFLMHIVFYANYDRQ